MNRRDFLKSALTVAALAPLAKFTSGAENAAPEAPDPFAAVDLNQPGKVTRRRLGKTGVTVPLLGFGMMRLPQTDGKIDRVTAEAMIAEAMKANCNYFDTAYMYHGGESEKFAGEALSKYPRSSYTLTSKMPVWMARGTRQGVERIFREQLKRCRTDYFDFYLVHSLSAGNWQTAKKLGAVDFLKKMKSEGKIRHLGFSFHDTPEVLRTIVKEEKDWEFGQIQLNYLDWDLYRSREQYEILTEANIPVIVMEPLRGGALAELSPDATRILKNAEPDRSVASWAFRYVASLPNVACILSGMTRPEHVADNIKTFSPIHELSEVERKTLNAALLAYRKHLAVPCTACRYCMPCPVGVEIPRIFGIYNQYKVSGNRWQFNSHYNSLPKSGRANACVGCRSCVQRCPQKIQIPEMLAKIAEEVK